MLRILLIFACTSLIANLKSQSFDPINPNDIEIVRDQWCVPHIYGKTDADAAYGLAWANAEDAFKEIQEVYMVTKPISGRNEGVDGAKADFFSHFIRADELVKEKINTLPKSYLKYIDGYAQGLNKYAETHPKEVKVKGLFPITINEVVKLPLIILSAFTKAGDAIGDVYGNKIQEQEDMGSNAIAANQNKTIDGKTYFLTNPHMPVTGPFSFYEAQINSEEGLNIHGALFMGGTSIFLGSNNNLGWGMTWNKFDRGDIYKLKMHPTEKLTYQYDGEWKKLEERKTTLKVKVLGFIKLPVKKTTYWSELGPVIKQKKGDDYFAIKYPSFYTIEASYQWYLMNKASNYREFEEALERQAISMFNIIYADKEGNIYYVNNGRIPKRNPELVKLAYIPGDSSKNVWQELHTLDELPHAFNPPSGFVFNTNNTQFHNTDVFDSAFYKKAPFYMDSHNGNNNRATRILELMAAKDKINFDYFQQIKFDEVMSKNTYFFEKIAPIRTANPADHPEISDMLKLIQNWSWKIDTNDIHTTAIFTSISVLFESKGYDNEQFISGFNVTNEEMFNSIKEAKKWLLKHYGTIEVPFGKIFKAEKGNRSVTAPGFPDVLLANYGRISKDHYKLKHGDTYTHFVKFGKDGVEELRTQVPFGSSNHPEDEAYFNQAELFRTHQTKRMSLNKETVYKKAKKIYHPK